MEISDIDKMFLVPALYNSLKYWAICLHTDWSWSMDDFNSFCWFLCDYAAEEDITRNSDACNKIKPPRRRIRLDVWPF